MFNEWCADWKEVYEVLREILGLSADDQSVIVETGKNTESAPAAEELPAAKTAKGKGTKGKKGGKRKVEEAAEPETVEDVKRTKTDEGGHVEAVGKDNEGHMHAQAAAAYIPFLDAASLAPPKMPSRQEMEQVLLDLRKKALVEEYFGDPVA